MEQLWPLIITRGGVQRRVDLRSPVDLSIPLDFDGPQPNAFGLPRAWRSPYRAGDFVASVEHGAGFNCMDIGLNPHGNGTHTECVGHICAGDHFVHDHLREAFIPATLLSVELDTLARAGESYLPLAQPHELVITAAALHLAWLASGADALWMDALIVRTFPNDPQKRSALWSGQSPAYLSFEAMRWIVNRQVRHLLVDLPSVDREQDQGLLPNHHTFWHVPQGQQQPSPLSQGRTITELIHAPSSLPDGPALLNLQIPPFLLDAAPSRPLLYRLDPAS